LPEKYGEKQIFCAKSKGGRIKPENPFAGW